LTLLRQHPTVRGEFVFTTTVGERQISGFLKAETRLNTAIDLLRKEDGAARQFGRMLPWVYHDLRRTMRMYLSGLPVQDFVRELVIAPIEARNETHRIGGPPNCGQQ
jgi:hypothetical protein